MTGENRPVKISRTRISLAVIGMNATQSTCVKTRGSITGVAKN